MWSVTISILVCNHRTRIVPRELIRFNCVFRNFQNRIENMIEDGGKSDKKMLRRDECVREIMREYINHHLEVINARDTVENVCSNLALCVFVADCFHLCFLMYYITLVRKRTQTFRCRSHLLILGSYRWFQVFSLHCLLGGNNNTSIDVLLVG